MRNKLERILSQLLTGSLVVWKRWNPLAYPEWQLGVQPHCIFRIFWILCAQKYCPCSALVFMKSKKFVHENIKICTLISHFASISGDFVPLTTYRGFSVDHTGGRKSFRPPNPWLRPLTQFLIHPSELPLSLHCEIHGYADGETHSSYHPLKAVGSDTLG